MNLFGLSEKDFSEMIAIFKSVPEIEEVIIFGSRATGKQKTASDIDLAVKGEKITFKDITKIKTSLEHDTFIPYFFDVIEYNAIQNQDLIDHINQYGKKLYSP